MKSFVIMSLVLMSPFSKAGWVTGFGSEQPVNIDDFRPKLHNNGGYSEGWSHGVWMTAGGDLSIDFAITNLGIGNHKGRVGAEFRDAQDRHVRCSQDFSDDEWQSLGQGFHLQFGGSELKGDMTGIDIKLRCDEIEMDLRFETKGDPFKVGTLHYQVDDEEKGYYSLVYTSPRARVTGTVRSGGITTSIEGIGYGEHMRTTLRPDIQARRWFRFSYVNPEISIFLAELESPTEFGSAHNGWMVIYGSEGRILATSQARFDYDGFIRDLSADEGYTIPRRVRLVASEKNAGIVGSLVMKKISKIVDPLDDLSAITRIIVRRFVKPRDYYIDCSFSFQIQEAKTVKKITGDRFFRFIFTNP